MRDSEGYPELAQEEPDEVDFLNGYLTFGWSGITLQPGKGEKP